jgi:hypothetical protein
VIAAVIVIERDSLAASRQIVPKQHILEIRKHFKCLGMVHVWTICMGADPVPSAPGAKATGVS